ncbi:H/ACA ribonucleoprotein complex subunit GAR1-like [Penaeus japonicus]|uniref:H/ACA ribonucleoprotein complex subunit GAR1-like n=1 Tax=Penaeus japonicus TaxID=27405 RepID=UPI001C712F39|nr:H/ACA ribonucleoprotein complex subunit GAR1-like [Penaeus japonicus]
MKLIGLLLAVASAAIAAPQGYDLGAPSGGGLSSGAGLSTGVAGEVGQGAITGCRDGEVLHVDGTCAIPEITRKVYLFNVPEQEQAVGPPPSIPPPAVEHNILFVRLPEEGPAPEPIVVPPPRQNNIVYVLNKQGEQVQQVIEVPAPPQADPEIYFVNYQEGENPTLPLGVDLETALGSAAAAGGLVLGGTEGAGGEGGFGGVGGAAGGFEVVNGGGFGGVGGAAGGFEVVNGGGFGGVGGAGFNGGSAGVHSGQGSRPSGLYNTP